MNAMRATAIQRCCAFSFGSLLLLGCGETGRQGTAAAGEQRAARPEMSYSLTATQMSVVQAIGPGVREPKKQKFVHVELSGIVNPDKQPILFELYFLPAKGEKVLLGTFSPYPPDRPGNFIVATRGQLRSEGAVVLSMVLPGKTEAPPSLRVEVKKIGFRER
jgi:hypothetical protein